MKTSIVITAYNVEQYIAKSIISAMQEGVDEIIVVEDKSTDNTLTVIKEIIENSKRDIDINLIINKENIGAGLSRRIGIENCKNEYVLLLDGDDYLDKGFIKELLDKAKETDADIVSGGIKIIKEDGTWTAESYGTCVIEGNEKVSRFWGERIVFMNNKIIRKKLYDLVPYNHRRFIEDTPTIIPILWYANKTAYIDNIGYNYVMRNNSLTHTTNTIKDVIYKGLCWLDLMDFFLEKDKTVFNYIDISGYIKNLLTIMNNIKTFDVAEINKYKDDWVEFTTRFFNLISIHNINFKTNEQNKPAST